MALIRLRRGTKAEWLASTRILADGEPGLASDTGEVRYGNGLDTWSNLPTVASGASGSATVLVVNTFADAPANLPAGTVVISKTGN